jgi:hypothetical protein
MRYNSSTLPAMLNLLAFLIELIVHDSDSCAGPYGFCIERIVHYPLFFKKIDSYAGAYGRFFMSL